MKTTTRTPSWSSRHQLSIRRVASADLQSKIHDAVACRAYELYEARGGTWGHDAEDWERAYGEVVGPLLCGSLEHDRRICLTADASCFDEGPVEIWIEPRRVTICGFDRSSRPFPTPPGEPTRPRENWIFRVHDLAIEVDPSGVTARFNGPALDIYLPKVHAHVVLQETPAVK